MTTLSSAVIAGSERIFSIASYDGPPGWYGVIILTAFPDLRAASTSLFTIWSWSRLGFSIV